MNLLKFFKLYSEFILDKERKIEYSVVVDKGPPIDFNNLIIFHEYSTFSKNRLKDISSKSYKCGYGVVIQSVRPSKGYKILTVATDQKSSNEISSIYKYFDLVIETNNVGQDFGGYFSAMREVRKRGWNLKYATLINSSQFLSTLDLTSFIEKNLSKSSFAGVSWGYGPRFKFKKYLHLQSFLLKYHFPSLLKILEEGYNLESFFSSKYKIIDKGEVGLFRKSIEHGLSPKVFRDDSLVDLESKYTSYFHSDNRTKIIFK